jgi:hypothetical protein
MAPVNYETFLFRKITTFFQVSCGWSPRQKGRFTGLGGWVLRPTSTTPGSGPADRLTWV